MATPSYSFAITNWHLNMIYRQNITSFDSASDPQKRALAYCQSLQQGDQSPPLYTAFKLIELPARILPTTHLVDVLDGGQEFRFRYWGSGMTEFLGYDATGKTTEDLIPTTMGDRVREVFRSMVSSKQALAMMSEFERPNSGIVGFQKFIRVPLAAADGTVAQILSVVEFLVDRYAARDLLSGTTDLDRTGDT